MLHDVMHDLDCDGLQLDDPEPRDCTCGVIIDCLMAERDYLRKELDDLYNGVNVVLPRTREHAEALHAVAHASVVGTEHIKALSPASKQEAR